MGILIERHAELEMSLLQPEEITINGQSSLLLVIPRKREMEINKEMKMK